MSSSNQINKRVADALESIEGIRRAEPAPWFYTRVNARMQRQAAGMWEHAGRLLSRPGIALAGILVILTMNVVLLSKGPAAQPVKTEQAAIESESLIASSSSFDYENIGQ